MGQEDLTEAIQQSRENDVLVWGGHGGSGEKWSVSR